MKKLSTLLLIGAVGLLFGSCEHDDLPTPGPGHSGDKQPPSVPANLAGIPTTTTVALTWNASTDNVGVAGYIIYRGTVSIDTVNTLGMTDTGLVPQTGYTYQVLAFDAAGNKSTKSAAVTITTLVPAPAVAPTVVTDVSFTSVRTEIVFKGIITSGSEPITERFFLLRWTDPITGNEQTDSVAVQGTGTTFEYTKTDVLPGLGYYCRAGVRNNIDVGYGQEGLAYSHGRHVGQDVGYGIVVHTYANYDSAIVLSYADLNFMSGAPFGNPSLHIYETSPDLLAGKANTDMILAHDPGPSAARVCRQYSEANKVWSLPSNEEWVKIKDIKHHYYLSNTFFGIQLSSGGYIGKYWTSTQASGTAQAYQMDIWDDNASIGTGEKTSFYAVRPITYIGPND